MIFCFILLFYISTEILLKIHLKRGNKQVNFAKTFIATFLIVIGKILDTIFKLLACQWIGDDVVQFYFADTKCYTATWITSFIILIFIIIIFSLVFIRLRKMKIEERQNPKFAAINLINRYKPQYYGWEYLLFVRRVLIALFSVSVHDISWKFIFIGLMIYFAYIQHKFNPFVVKEANDLEIILLLCFVFITTVEISSVINKTLINIIVSFLIIFPIPLLIHYIYSLYKQQIDSTQNPKKYDVVTVDDPLPETQDLKLSDNINDELVNKTAFMTELNVTGKNIRVNTHTFDDDMDELNELINEPENNDESSKEDTNERPNSKQNNKKD
eukprot:115416_1